MYLRAILLLTIMLTFLLAPDVALAQSNLFEVPGTDKSMIVLRAIFGDLFESSGGANPMMAGINAFNSAVLVIGGLLVSYTILIGTIGTAHDGEMLGKKFSSAWVPIRTAAGTALVLPIIGGGYCIMQAIVAWLIMQGIGLADLVWSKYTSDTNMQFLASKGVVSSNVKTMGYDIFKVMYCKNVITEMNKDLRANEAAKNVMPEIVGVSVQSGNNYIVGASPAEVGLQSNSCGVIKLPTSNSVSPTTGVSGAVNNFLDIGSINAASQALTTANKEATVILMNDLNTLAKKMAEEKTIISPTQIDAAIAKYQESVNKKAGEVVGQLKEFKTMAQNSSSDGWFLAGAYYTKMAWFSDAVFRATSNIATVSTPANNIFASPTFQDAIQVYGDLLTKSTTTASGAPISQFGINTEAGFGNDKSSELFAMVLGDSIKNYMLDPNEHPLMSLKRLGSFLLTTYAAIAGILVALGSTSSSLVGTIVTNLVTLGSVNVKEGLLIIIQLIQPFMSIFLTVGLILSYVLPMMPFFLWFGATLGWIVMCIEAILAAPMWAVMHLSPHGDDLVGTGSQGYKLVLSLMLRPVLMIFGLIASFVIIQVVGQMLSEIFAGAFAAAQSDSFILVKFFGYIVVMPALYAWTMFVLIKKSFSMIHVIPEEMLKWFGGASSPQLGDFANTVGGEGQGAMAGAAIMATQARGLTQNLGNSATKKLQDDIKDAKDTDRSIAAAFGNNAGNISELQDGKSSLDKQQFMKKYDAEKSSMGGEGSIGGEAFDQAFQNVSASSEGQKMTTSEKFNAAKSQALDTMFGTPKGGASGAIKQLSGGSLSGGKFNAIMSDISGKADVLKGQGMTSEQANSSIGAALYSGLGNAQANAAEGPPSPRALKQSVEQEFNKLGLADSTISTKPIAEVVISPKTSDDEK
jgi:conjugal transfer/type IV secretion protein DotA/TraY